MQNLYLNKKSPTCLNIFILLLGSYTYKMYQGHANELFPHFVLKDE